MSASIHMHIEVRSGDTWYHYASPSLFRQGNTIFFDLLGGIYDKHKPIVPPRGLPENLSFVTQHDWKQDSEGYSLHHAGWLSADELWELQAQINKLYSEPNTVSMASDLESGLLHTFINGNVLAMHQGWDDLRLIFWFDN